MIKITKVDMEILEKLPNDEWFHRLSSKTIFIKRFDYRCRRLFKLNLLKRKASAFYFLYKKVGKIDD